MSLPKYEPMLAAYHRAFATELQEIVNALPLSAGQTVLDMACGDGAYTAWLAACVGGSGRVVAVDSNPEYLEMARKGQKISENIEFLCAPIDGLPFEEGTFDLCWCAQSLYSLPNPAESLKHMLRTIKPGGIIAVLESDTLHHVILPWPVEVELSVRAAELQVLAEKMKNPHKFYVGRRLNALFREVNLTDITVKTFAHDRNSPLDRDERIYFTEHLKDLSERVEDHLDGPVRQRFTRMADPESAEFLLNDPDFAATCIDQLAWGRKSK